jgi:hypothetical protein
VAHVAIRPELSQNARDDEGRHLLAPDGSHHQGGHEHVAAEVGRVGRQSGHQLFVRRQELYAAHLPLEPARACRSAVALCLGEKAQEGGIEDLVTRERREGASSGGDRDREGNGVPAACGKGDGIAAPRGAHAREIDAQLQDEGIARVERRLHDSRDPRRAAGASDDGRREPGADRRNACRVDEAKVLAARRLIKKC